MPFVSNSPTQMLYLLENQASTYGTISVLTVVLYDYVLNLDQEILLIWYGISPLTYCYFFLRYVGLIFPLVLLVFRFPVVLSDKDCTILNALYTNALPTALIMAVQGVMSARVCALYENSKTVNVSLGSAFIVVQLLNIAFSVTAFLPPFDYSSQEGIILGIRGCINFASELPPLWAGVIPNGSNCAYELVLVSMLVYRTVLYLREHRRQSSVPEFTGMIKLMMEQGLVYFIWAITSQTLGAIYLFSTTLPVGYAASITFDSFVAISSTTQLCILGPWLILSIRQNHLAHVNGGSSMTRGTISTVAFGRPQSVPNEPEALGNEGSLQVQDGGA